MGLQYNIQDKDSLVNRAYYKDIPKHLLLLPDGDRRYAKEQGITDMQSYDIARSKTRDFIEVALGEFDLQALSIFFLRKRSFTDQNRTNDNLNSIYIAIINLAEDLLSNRTSLDINRVHVNTVCAAGRPWMEIPDGLQDNKELSATWAELKRVLTILRERPKALKQINFLINYSGKAEVESAVKTGKFQITSPIGLTIRVGDGMRLSDCPLYALSESHLYLINKYFPEVTKEDIRKVLRLYYPI